VTEWTPEVSARGWARVLAAQAESVVRDDVLLVAAEDSGRIVGLLYGDLAEGGATGEVGALYVSSGRHRQGIGAALLRAGATELQRLGASALHISVLTDNVLARRFYEGMGGIEVGHGTFDEEGHLLPTTVYEWSDVSVLVGG
jgi:ribosomal protein S18 acetylase RimI-like enzyme